LKVNAGQGRRLGEYKYLKYSNQQRKWEETIWPNTWWTDLRIKQWSREWPDIFRGGGRHL